jgi:hypothetical protein
MTKRFLPCIVAGVLLVYLASAGILLPVRSAEGFNFTEFGRLPVSMNGRVQPIDSVARIGLLQIRGTVDAPLDDVRAIQFRTRTLGAIEWLLELLAKPDAADRRRIFPIKDAVLLTNLKVSASATGYYTFRELESRLDEIGRHVQRIAKLKTTERAAWERELLTLRARLVIYERLKNSLQPNSFLQHEASGKPVAYDFAGLLAKYRVDLAAGVKVAIRRQHGSDETLDKATEESMRAFARPFQGVSRAALLAVVPPISPADSRDHWHTMGGVIVDSARSGALPLPVAYVAAISTAFAQGKADLFNQEVAKYRQWLVNNGLATEVSKARYEYFHGVFQPLVRAAAIYLVGLALIAASWRRRSTTVYRSAVLLVLLAGALHTTGLIFDMMLTGRPPVTNRYSLIIFGGWALALLALAGERWVARTGIGVAAAAAVALTALVTAYGLAPGGAAALIRNVFDLPFAVATVAVVVALRLGRDAKGKAPRRAAMAAA